MLTVQNITFSPDAVMAVIGSRQMQRKCYTISGQQPSYLEPRKAYVRLGTRF